MHTPDHGKNPEPRRSPAPVRPAATAPTRIEPGPLTGPAALALQRSIGNRAVGLLVQRAQHQHGAGCGHDQAEQPSLQRSAVHDVLSTPGQALAAPRRQEMESRLGADFSDVRVHTDSAARASAAEVGARAYTSGNHIVIGAGGGDSHTLAHELTHVIQQRQGPVAGSDNGSGLRVSDPSDRFEREAETNATRAMSGAAPVQRTEGAPSQRSGAAGTLQRAKDNGEGSSTGGASKQGEHIFNALNALVQRMHGGLTRALELEFSHLDTYGADAATLANAETARQTAQASLNDLGDLIRTAADLRDNARFRSAMQGAAKGPDGDANSQSYSAFCTNVTAAISSCQNRNYAGLSALRGYSDGLIATIKDTTAQGNKSAELGSSARTQREFSTWVTDTETAMRNLYAGLIEAARLVNLAVVAAKQIKRPRATNTEAPPPEPSATS
ncbi:eCIS core domain-containing protein [Kitasatospora indigofera]|uniref:eCIS core domain-containing protein n=1 Tax=Kitasatospora indigofera TaxID=67307 RepID=UPI003252CB05